MAHAGWCEEPTGHTVVDAADTAYVVIDCFPEMYGTLCEGHANVWVYEESNRVPGLQRGGVSLLGDRDWCQSTGTPDTLVI